MFREIGSVPGASRRRNHRFLHKGGKYIWIETVYTNLLNDDSIKAIVINYRDITARAEAEEKAIHSNRIFQVIGRVNQMITHVADQKTLFRRACEIAVDVGHFRMAWIGIIDDDLQQIIPMAFSGEEQGYLSGIKSEKLDNIDSGYAPLGKAIRTGSAIYVNDVENDPLMKECKEQALECGYRGCVVLPIRKFKKVIGVYALYVSTLNYFDAHEIALCTEIANDISFALEGLEKAANAEGT